MAAGWHKLSSEDVLQINSMLQTFRKDAAANYAAMTFYCWSRLYSKGKPPYFTVGQHELAKLCGGVGTLEAKTSIARRFLAKCERDGFFVRLDDAKPGKVPRRTFWFLLPESDILGAPLFSIGAPLFSEKAAHPNASSHIKAAHPNHVSPDKSGALTESTETQSKTSASLLVETSDSDVESLIREHYEKAWRLDYLVAPPGEVEVADGDGS